MALSVLLAACTSDRGHDPRSGTAPLRPTRGYILISIDTLRADHLGSYGYDRDTSPFFDSLAAAGVLFENAVVQLPGTLPSHMSIFTGLYPGEHGVYPPDKVLPFAIPTLPEVFRRHGYRTAGYTEGGYVDGGYGFARGFEDFRDDILEAPDDIERTFRRGLDFLRGLGSEEPFFLFLHTYAVHDPYTPPRPYHNLFWDEEPPTTFRPTGPNLSAFNRGELTLTPEGRDYFVALYDGSIRYMDEILGRFFSELEDLGLAEDTTVVITSDHGEEFLEHGKLAHDQIYHEALNVPLLVLHPELDAGRRISALVESIDIAPTLYELLGLVDLPSMSGESLVPLLTGEAPAHPREAYAEAFAAPGRTLYRQKGDQLHQLLELRPRREADGGLWASRSLSFDWREPNLRFRAYSHAEPRTIDLLVDGALITRLEVSTSWREYGVKLSPFDHKVQLTLSTPDCASPANVDPSSKDGRCLSFKVRGLSLARTELYDIVKDPAETRDLSRLRPELEQELLARLQTYTWDPPPPVERAKLPEDLERRLRALGYIR